MWILLISWQVEYCLYSLDYDLYDIDMPTMTWLCNRFFVVVVYLTVLINLII